MNEKQNRATPTVQAESLLMKDRRYFLELNRHDFIWITEEKGSQTDLPLQVQSVSRLQTQGEVETVRKTL